MPGQRIPQLDAIAGASTANDDNLVIYDTDAGTTKRILRSQLAAGLVGDLPYTPAGFITATTVPTAIAEIATDLAAAGGASSGSSLVGYLPSGTGAVATTVQGKLREHPSPKDFGAPANGVDDDGPALVLAGAALSAGIIKTLDFGNSNYLVSSGTRFDVNGAAGISIIGDGATINFVDGASARPFVIRNSTNVHVSGIAFVSTARTTGSNDNLDIMNCSDVWISGNTFTGANFYGCGVFEDTIGGTSAACNNVNITDNLFKSCGNTAGIGLEIFPKVKSYGLLVDGNIFDSCGSSAGGSLKAGSAYENAQVSNNLIRSSQGSGIAAATWESIVIKNNVVLDYGSLGIALSSNTHPSYLSPSLESCEVSGNVFAFSDGSAATGTNAISVNGTAATNGPIRIERNKIFGGRGGIICRPVAAMPFISFVGNEFVDLPKASIAIYSDAALGSAPVALVVDDNKFVNNDLTRTTAPINLSGCTNASIRRNEIVRGGNQSVALTSCGGSYVEDNLFFEPNPANTASVGCVNVTDSTAVDYYVRSNRVVTGTNGNPKAIYNGGNATPTVYLDGNIADSVSVSPTVNSTPNIAADGATPFVQYGRARHFYGTAEPVSGGVYQRGDLVWNTAPAASQPPGWVCVSGGSPGTWKAMANLAA